MRKFVWIVAGVLCVCGVGAAQAADELYIQAGDLTRPAGAHSPSDIEIGAGWDLPWQWLDHHLVTRIEAGAGYDNAKLADVWRVVVTPVLRYRFNGEQSNGVFVEAGIGPAYIDHTVWSTGHDMGSHALFQDRLSVGYTAGTNEVSLGLTHLSSAGLKEPNPGAEIVDLRYAHRF